MLLLIVLVVLTVWVGFSLVIVGACVSAARGDRPAPSVRAATRRTLPARGTLAV